MGRVLKVGYCYLSVVVEGHWKDIICSDLPIVYFEYLRNIVCPIDTFEAVF